MAVDGCGCLAAGGCGCTWLGGDTKVLGLAASATARLATAGLAALAGLPALGLQLCTTQATLLLLLLGVPELVGVSFPPWVLGVPGVLEAAALDEGTPAWCNKEWC